MGAARGRINTFGGQGAHHGAAAHDLQRKAGAAGRNGCHSAKHHRQVRWHILLPRRLRAHSRSISTLFPGSWRVPAVMLIAVTVRNLLGSCLSTCVPLRNLLWAFQCCRVALGMSLCSCRPCYWKSEMYFSKEDQTAFQAHDKFL